MTAPEARRVRLRWLSAATFAFSLLAVSGCGGSGPPRAEVGGQVTLDGRPMEEGNLSLIPAEGTKGPTTVRGDFRRQLPHLGRVGTGAGQVQGRDHRPPQDRTDDRGGRRPVCRKPQED